MTKRKSVLPPADLLKTDALASATWNFAIIALRVLRADDPREWLEGLEEAAQEYESALAELNPYLGKLAGK